MSLLATSISLKVRLGHTRPEFSGPVSDSNSKGRFRDAVLARSIGGLGPSVVLLQHSNDLLFREPCSLQSGLRRDGLELRVEENHSGRIPSFLCYPGF